jgi:hypothetical protein
MEQRQAMLKLEADTSSSSDSDSDSDSTDSDSDSSTQCRHILVMDEIDLHHCCLVVDEIGPITTIVVRTVDGSESKILETETGIFPFPT